MKTSCGVGMPADAQREAPPLSPQFHTAPRLMWHAGLHLEQTDGDMFKHGVVGDLDALPRPDFRPPPPPHALIVFLRCLFSSSEHCAAPPHHHEHLHSFSVSRRRQQV